MQAGGLDRPEHRPKDRPTTVAVAGQSPLEATSDMAVRWTDFNGELRALRDAEKAGEDQRTSTTFPRVQPHLQCGKWWLGAIHPPLPLCATVACWRPTVQAANDPTTWLGSVVGARGMRGNACRHKQGCGLCGCEGRKSGNIPGPLSTQWG